MSIQLKSDEITYLEQNFRLTQKATKSELSIPAENLEVNELLYEYLRKVQLELNAPNLTVAASLFAKRYSYLTLVPAFYSLSVFQKKLDVSLGNINIESDDKQQVWLPLLRLYDLNMEPLAQKNTLGILENIFANNLNRVWESITNTVNINKEILWENSAVYLFWLYENIIDDKKDFNIILEAPGSIFGERHNPIFKFYDQKKSVKWDSGETRVRITCCLNHCIDGLMCKTCPKK